MLLPNKAVWLNEKMLLLKFFELEQYLEVAQESSVWSNVHYRNYAP